ILVKSYDALGMTQLRDDADRVMKSTFKDDAELKLSGDKTKTWWKLW
ncbi:MAG: outer membrane protein assembly factor BamD, partial [Comamonas sp.]